MATPTGAGLVLVIVLAAAVLHAVWNALAKALPNRLVTSTSVGLVCLVVGSAGAPFVPVPRGWTWLFLTGSAILQVLYLLLLTSAYGLGEFGRVYPLSRGMAPLLITIFSLTVLGEHFSVGQLAGVFAVLLALTTLLLVGKGPRKGDGLGLALITGAIMAAYTLIDGIGVRYSGEAGSYAVWLFLIQAPLMIIVCRCLAGPDLVRQVRPNLGRGLLVGVLSLIAYALVLWAQSHGNLALVSALRETSVIFAGLIGAVFFREQFGPVRLAATVLAVAGIVMMQAAPRTAVPREAIPPSVVSR